MSRYEKLIKDPVAREREVLALWDEQGTFQRSLAATKGRPRYVFFEGPPTTNGMPHLGHLMPRVYKDLFPRYKTMQGFYVARKGGWDTHGLPVELEVEKEIGLNSKAEIEAYGVERFIEKCKESVWKYKAEWEQMVERMGFWIDLKNAYVTYTDDYIESLWWELAQMHKRGLLYQGHKVLPYCPRCGTGLSSHEVAQGYRMVKDPAIAVRMKIVAGGDASYNEELPGKTSLLTWTTTPWTLPANVGLAIAANETYVEVEQNGERLILAAALLERTLNGDFRLVREIDGADLVGLAYEPPYRLLDDKSAYQVHAAGFVNMDDGSGIVHTSPAFGEDDYLLGREKDLPFFHPVDLSGAFTAQFPLCEGTFVKDADPTIVEDLKGRGLLYSFTPYEHDYPFCWRCDTPLLYYAMDSWYIKMTAVKKEIIANNRAINWCPSHIGEKRLGDFLENLRDWALSRDRYWGTPLNLWVCKGCQETIAVGSREELVDRAFDKELAQTVEFHRPQIDRVELACPECDGRMNRVSSVIDAWFDAGSMHIAQWHYPFENEELFKESFPADFICEATDQTRGWFYTLLATSTIIHGEPPFRNCIVTGFGLDENGVKMSKSKGNVIDLWELIDRYGADCLRWYFYASSAPWKSKRLGDAAIKEPLYRFLDTLRNTYDFFALYASIDEFDPQVHCASEEDLSVLDRWILSRLAATEERVVDGLDRYDVIASTSAIEEFLDQVSNWYVRSSRRRFWKGGMGPDKIAAYTTLYTVLSDLSRLIAPFIPFISEAIYQRLRTTSDPESVHLCRYPQPDTARLDTDLDAEMDLARGIVSLGRQARQQAQVKVRQPLSRVIISHSSAGGKAGLSEGVLALVKAELNVEEVQFAPALTSYFEESPSANFRTLGPRLGAHAQGAAKWIVEQSAAEIREALSSGLLQIEVGGEQVALEEADVVFDAILPEGFVLAEEGELRLLLDTTLGDALREKGLVRELIHRIQVLRKEAGFDVIDRIALAYQGDPVLVAVIANNRETICSEVLALEVEATLDGEYEHRQKLEIDDLPIEFGLARILDSE